MKIDICNVCDGTGQVQYSEGHHAGSTTVKIDKCSSCGGTGRVVSWNFAFPVKIPFGQYQKEAAAFQSEMSHHRCSPF